MALLLCLLVLGPAAVVVVWRLYVIQRRLRSSVGTTPKVVAFFHPHCATGGGGERVLWKMIEVLGDLIDRGWMFQVVVYTVDPSTPTYKQDVLRLVEQRFSIRVSDKLPLSFLHLDQYQHFLAQSSRFSLVMESLGTMKLAYAALSQLTPHIFFDTTGCAFTYVVARLWFGCPHVLAYVHYPTISTDMLHMVFERRRSAYNHSEQISASRIRTAAKLLYHTVFAVLYGMVGSLATLVLVNSSWTYNHIRSLWKCAAWRQRLQILFPPCNVADLADLDLIAPRQLAVVSIGQFRPEKDHVLQLEALEVLRRNHADCPPATLVLIGSCRGPDDEARLAYLRNEAKRRKLDDCVEFVVNQPYDVVKDWLQRGSVGIHTMWNEHFGIGIVEMMAAGLIVVAHNSGGPKSDIVVPLRGVATGYLAGTADEYAASIHEALTLAPQEALQLRQAARESSERFSDQAFAKDFQRILLEAKVLL